MSDTKPLSSEELQAAMRTGVTTPRITTRVDADSLRASRTKMRLAAAKVETMRDISHPDRADLLHSIWKAMSFLDDSLTVGMQRVVKRR